MSTEQIVTALRRRKAGCATVLIMQGVLVCIWCLAHLVPGFVLFDGAPGVISAYTHSAWWLALELIIMWVGWASLDFGLYYNDGFYIAKHKGRVDKSGAATYQWLDTYRWLCVIGCVSHCVHFFLTLFESNATGDARSTLFRDYLWCYIALCILLAFAAILSAWQVTRAAAYRSDLYCALTGGKETDALVLYLASTTPEGDEQDADPAAVPDVEAPPVQPAQARIVHHFRSTRYK